MQGSTKNSLMTLQQHIERELKKMPKSPTRSSPLNLRHTIGSNPEQQLREALHNIRSFKSSEQESSRKRQYSLTSTRIPETRTSSALKHISSAQRLETKKEMRHPKTGIKTKLKKKLSKQESPKPFLKLNRGQTLPEQGLSKTSGRYQRKQFTGKEGLNEQKKYLSPEQYQLIIENQARLIDYLQKIIETMQDM